MHIEHPHLGEMMSLREIRPNSKITEKKMTREVPQEGFILFLEVLKINIAKQQELLWTQWQKHCQHFQIWTLQNSIKTNQIVHTGCKLLLNYNSFCMMQVSNG